MQVGDQIALNAGARTFSYVVSGVVPDGQASGIPFVDTEGTRIKCNWAHMFIHYDTQAVGNDKNHVICWAEPSSLTFTHTANSITDKIHIATEYTTNDLQAGNVSGVCGHTTFADHSNPGLMSFKAHNGATFDSLQVRVFEYLKSAGGAGEISFEVTYGTVSPVNNLRYPESFDSGV
jgi:hypothetical protein